MPRKKKSVILREELHGLVDDLSDQDLTTEVVPKLRTGS
jgi:hypothetical protein